MQAEIDNSRIISGTRDSKRRISICDTTLRDGEQACGVVFNKEMKIEIARKLDELGVECIDVGFPAISRNECDSIKEICKLGLKATIVACCRPNKKEIDLALDCGVDGIFTFIPTSEIHMYAKFEGSIDVIKAKLNDMIIEAIEYAKLKKLFVGFGAEDATRSNLDYLLEVFRIVQDAGADLISPADTVGIMTPEKVFHLVKRIKEEIHITIAMHCHNDFGLAVINTIAGVNAGADQAQVTVNGIGERAGNASLEEVVMASHSLYGYHTNIKLEKLTEISRLVEKYSRIKNHPAKSIVGQNAFSHESGIHVSSVLKDPTTYEPFEPCLVGQERRFTIGKHSGKNILRHILNECNIEISNNDLELLLNEVKGFSEKRLKGVTRRKILQLYRFLKNSSSWVEHKKNKLCQ